MSFVCFKVVALVHPPLAFGCKVSANRVKNKANEFAFSSEVQPNFAKFTLQS